MTAKGFGKRLASLLFGLALYALGAVFTMRAGWGFAPWEVFHSGVGSQLGIALGTASIVMGLLIVLVDHFCGEALGLGTWLNMLLIGSFINLFTWLDFIPAAQGLLWQAGWLALGLLIIAFATYFYISAGMGTGPRDCLMLILSRRTGISPGKCKMFVEWTAVLIGWLLGGPVGVGTIAAAFGGGVFTDLVFRLFRFDPKAIQHQRLGETLRMLTARKEKEPV